MWYFFPNHFSLLASFLDSVIAISSFSDIFEYKLFVFVMLLFLITILSQGSPCVFNISCYLKYIFIVFMLFFFIFFNSIHTFYNRYVTNLVYRLQNQPCESAYIDFFPGYGFYPLFSLHFLYICLAARFLLSSFE